MTMPSRNVIIAGSVSLIGIIAALVFGLSFTGHLDASSVPLVTELLGVVVTTVPAFFALSSAEKAKDAANNASATAQQTQHDIRNGVLKSKVAEAMVEVAQANPNMTISSTPVEDNPPVTNEGNSNG